MLYNIGFWVIPFSILFVACVVWLLLRWDASGKTKSAKQAKSPPRPLDPIVVGQLLYRGGDWDANAGALEAVCGYYQRHVDPSVRFEVRLGVQGRDLARVGFLYATGHFGFDLEPADFAGLTSWAAAGGTGLIEDNNGMDAAFRDFLRVHRLGLREVDPVLFREPFLLPGGRMPKIMRHAGRPAALFSIVMNGRPTRLYYSFSADLGDGWEPGEKHKVSAASKEASFQMGSNLIHHAIAGMRNR